MTQKENTFLRGKREHNNTEKVKKQNNLFYEIKQRHKKRGLAGLKSEINFSAYCHKKNLNVTLLFGYHLKNCSFCTLLNTDIVDGMVDLHFISILHLDLQYRLQCLD